MKNERNGNQDLTSEYQVNKRVYEVVTDVNNKLRSLRERLGTKASLGAITPEEMVWIQVFLETTDIRKASFAAYPDRVKDKYHARNLGKLKLEKPTIQIAMNELLDTEFSDDKVLGVVGNILYTSPNETNQLKAADMILRVKGTYAPEKRLTANVHRDYSELEPHEFEEETLRLLKESEDGDDTDILDEISLRD